MRNIEISIPHNSEVIVDKNNGKIKIINFPDSHPDEKGSEKQYEITFEYKD